MRKPSTLKVIGVKSAYSAPLKHGSTSIENRNACIKKVYSGVTQSFRTCNSNASFVKEGPSILNL